MWSTIGKDHAVRLRSSAWRHKHMGDHPGKPFRSARFGPP
jgi:hypothetical protein